MPIRHYGIYLAYPPTVDMRDQGLGRHLAMFLKGAERLTDIQFTIVCPSWTRGTLEALFESEQVSLEVFQIVSPDGKPYALRVFEALKAYRTRIRRPGWFSRLAKSIVEMGKGQWERLTARAVAVHDVVSLAAFSTEVFALLILFAPVVLLAALFVVLIFVRRVIGSIIHRLTKAMHCKLEALRIRASGLFANPHHENWVLRLFDEMQKHEMRRMQAKIAALADVCAWYCPTAFWPGFHEIRAPRVMCVPDIVLSDFPTGFSKVGGDRFLNTFDTIGQAIRAGEHFVTYSETVKWDTLVDCYAVPAANITVIPHAPNDLSRYVEVKGFPDVEATSRHYCKTLLRVALQRSTNPGYTATFLNGDVKFLFYASQFRPNKNVLMLFRAFEYLLRKRYLGHKLVLTGNPADMPEIGRFVVDHRLEHDVIFLHALSVSELAACYKLADLAVNPALSEGGCPFTFTEALSVGTPVVMSRISVTEEVLSDPYLQEVTFFDPYDWRDCAERIESAITQRDHLLAIQQAAYAKLAERTWSKVVEDHVRVLDRISVGADLAYG